MNCKQLDELLPLYAGRDLDEKRARLVSEHVQICPTCARAAGEYRDAVELTQHFAPPVFGEDVYAGIRRRVLREIEIESAASPQMFAGWFRPKLGWALASAFVIAVVAMAFYFVTVRHPTPRQMADGHPVNQEDGGHSSVSQANTSPERPPSRESGVPRPSATQNRKAAKERAVLVAAKVRETPARAREVKSVSRDDGEANAVPSNDATPADPPIRMEIQTRDPNIRIIWFTGRDGK